MQAGAVMELQLASPSHSPYRATCCKANAQLRTHQPLKFSEIMDAPSLSLLLSSVPGAPHPSQLGPETEPNHSTSTDHAENSSTAGEIQLLPVLCTDSERHRFLVCSHTKNVFGSDYHVRVPESRSLSMPIAEIRHCVRTWTASRLLLQVSGATGNTSRSTTGMTSQTSRACACG